MLRVLNLIQHYHPQIQIHIKKVKSHSNIAGNNVIDHLVRKKAQKTKYIQSHLYHTPYSVNLTQIHKFVSKSWKKSWENKSNPNRMITKSHDRFNKRINFLINNAKLNRHQCGIIVRLITEHIELNKHLFKHQIKCPKTEQIPFSPNCQYCNQIESVTHFLTKCKLYNVQRNQMMNKLIKINHRYKYEKFKSMKYLLFPYRLQHNNITKQTMVWKEILNYTKETKRFSNLYHINLNNL